MREKQVVAGEPGYEVTSHEPAVFFSWPHQVMTCQLKSGCGHCNPSSMHGLFTARHALERQAGSTEPKAGLSRDGHALESQAKDTAPLSFVTCLCMAKQALWSKVGEYVSPFSIYDHCRLHRFWRGVCDPMFMTPTAGPDSSYRVMLGKLCHPLLQQFSTLQDSTWSAKPRCVLCSTDDLLWACPVQVRLAGEAVNLSWLDSAGLDMPWKVRLGKELMILMLSSNWLIMLCSAKL